MRLTLELVDGIKQIIFPNMSGPHPITEDSSKTVEMGTYQSSKRMSQSTPPSPLHPSIHPPGSVSLESAN